MSLSIRTWPEIEKRFRPTRESQGLLAPGETFEIELRNVRARPSSRETLSTTFTQPDRLPDADRRLPLFQGRL